jgi:hypothetical protein
MIVVGVYRQLYTHGSEPLEHMTAAYRAFLDPAPETVHIYRGMLGGSRHEPEQYFLVSEAWPGRKCIAVIGIIPCCFVCISVRLTFYVVSGLM